MASQRDIVDELVTDLFKKMAEGHVTCPYYKSISLVFCLEALGISTEIWVHACPTTQTPLQSS